MGGHKTVLVLGGGIAGLAAARELAHRGLRATLLEARFRLGGRILTQLGQSHRPVELGAEFIHGRSPELWRILDSIPLPTAEASDHHKVLDEDGSLKPFQFQETIEQVTEQINSRTHDESFCDFLAHHSFPPEVRRTSIDYVEGFHAAHPERLSVHALSAAEKAASKIEGDRAFRITKGYAALVDWFEGELRKKGVEIICGAEAKALAWQPGQVSVDAAVAQQQESFDADACIVALPLGVLKAGCLQFHPPLPEKEKAIAALELGHVTKVVLRFKERFWPKNFGFVHTFDHWLPTWWTNDDPLSLTGWAGGPAGERGAEVPHEDLRDRAISVLAKTFSRTGTQIREGLTEIHSHNWRDDPFARMAYSYIPVNQLDAPRRLALPVASTLFFAGEATSLDSQNGTVHGALTSGLRAAQEVQRSEKIQFAC